MRNRGARLVFAVVVLLATATPLAGAHETPVDVVTVVEEVAPPVDGLTVQVASSVTTQLVLENTTGELVEVLDEAGRAFLRLDGDGVEGNLDVAAWYRSNDPFARVDVPEEALDDDATDDWRRVAVGPSWGWFDHRLHDGTLTVPAHPEQGEVLDRWRIPLRVGGEPVEVRGMVAFRPPLGTYQAVIGEQADGLVGQVLNGPTPALSVEHTGAGVRVVLGADGEPLLRFSPDGVEANLASRTWHEVARAMASVPLPAEVAGGGPVPVWQRLTTAPRFTWIDPRLALPVGAPDDPSFQTTVAAWSVPVQTEGRDEESGTGLAGEIRWLPASATTAPSDEGTGLNRGALVVVVLVAAVAAVTARRILRHRRA